MREPLCICWASLTSGIVVRAAVLVATVGEGAAEGVVRPVPAPVFVLDTGVVVVAVGAVVGAAGLLTLLPISKDAQEKKR
jgi:hypothetical protein